MKKDELVHYFGGEIGKALRNIPNAAFEDIREIRLRTERPAAVTLKNSIRYVTADGNFTYASENVPKVSQDDIRRTFEAVCQYSIHSFQKEIAEGFVTVKGGHRVGICGTFSGGTVKNISSLNFRAAKEVIGCSDELFGKIFSGGLCNLLVAGAPGSGKTTILRDISRKLGKNYRIALIDERGELAAVWNGVPQNDVGVNTDVFDGYDKPTGIMTAVRVMSPQVVICDEIGSGDSRVSAAQAADEMLGIEGVDASFVIFNTPDGGINISARSLGAMNVQIIMEKLGGGGHQTMAAAQFKDISIHDAKAKLIGAIDEHIANIS